MDTATSLEELSSSQRRIDDSFGVASWIAVVGVLLSWWYVKWDDPSAAVSAPSTASAMSATLIPAPSGDSLTEQADAAFARGDVIAPDGDNALHFYQQALAASPDDEGARRGINEVVEYLLNEAESAIFNADWERARDNTAEVLRIEPAHADAQELNRRAARSQRIEELLNRAVSLYAQGRLTVPSEDNAAATYQAVLELDPNNATALQGLESIVQRSIANAESALFAGRTAQAKDYLARAKAIDPDAVGIATLEQTERNMQALQENLEAKQDLAAAAEAVQADRLMPPAQPNAFTLYQRVLAREPDSVAAQRGLELVRSGLLDRARTLLAADDMAATLEHLDDAEQAGADVSMIAEVRDEATYRQRLIDAQQGLFDKLTAISELIVIRQGPPDYPRWADGADAVVALEMTVTETGEVRNVEITGEESRFDSSAIRAVRRWKFEPMMERGRPIPVRVPVKIRFQG